MSETQNKIQMHGQFVKEISFIRNELNNTEAVQPKVDVNIDVNPELVNAEQKAYHINLTVSVKASVEDKEAFTVKLVHTGIFMVDVEGTPRKARKEQLVKIQPMQRLTTSVEPTITSQAVTNVMKLIEGTYQATTQVNVLSPEMDEIIEVDALFEAEDSMKGDAIVSHHSLYRGLRQLHDMRWTLRELGRSSVFSHEYAKTSQSRRGLANDTEEVGLTDSTRSMGKPCTWGSGQQCDDWFRTCQVTHGGYRV